MGKELKRNRTGTIFFLGDENSIMVWFLTIDKLIKNGGFRILGKIHEPFQYPDGFKWSHGTVDHRFEGSEVITLCE